MSTSQFNLEEDKVTQSQSLSIDYKRIFFRALKYWYFLVVCLALGITIAYLINRYSTRIYPVKASIVIRQGDERSDARLLYNNPLVNPYKNFYNELYVLRSYPLVQEVVQKLNFHITVTKEGNIKSSEFYKLLPIEIEILDSTRSIQRSSFIFEPWSDDTFNCITEGENPTSSTFKFGQIFDCNGTRIRINQTGSLKKWLNARYVVAIQNPLDAASVYVSKLKASWAEQGASVVNLEIDGAIASKNVDFIEQLIKSYQQFDLNKKNFAAGRSIDFIDRQLVGIQDSLTQAEQALENFKKKNVVSDLGEEATRIYTRIQELETKLSEFRIQSAYYKYLEKYLSENPENDQIVLPSAFGIQDAVFNSLLSELVQLQLDVKLMPKKTMDNPLVKGLQDRIKEIKADVAESMKNLQSGTRIQNDMFLNQLAQLEKQLTFLPEAERRLVNLERSHTLNENLYIFLMQKRAEAGISRASNSTDIIIVNPPKSASATSPKVTQNYIISVLVGLFFPFAIFFLSELFNIKIQSKEDIEQFTTVPIIGGIGHNSDDDSMVMVSRPRSAMAESFRALRSNLSYFTNNQEHQIFMVTSSIPGEGKSFTTLNLASVFALTGKKTLIIGADLRKPKLYEELSLTNEKGLSQYLSGLATLPDIVQQSAIENLHFISGGAMPPNPSELLLKSAMAELLKKLKDEYDYVVLDTPPLGLVTDAFVLAPFVNHVLFVVRQDYTPRVVLQALEEYYSKGRLSNVSILFNDLRKTGLGYGYGNYGYQYNYGYGYGRKKKSDYYSD